MGGKGSGRPKGSDKPLSEVLAGIHKDIAELEDYVYRKCQGLRARIDYHIWKQQKIEEYRQKMRRLKKKWVSRAR